jgi:heme exporter protein B
MTEGAAAPERSPPGAARREAGVEARQLGWLGQALTIFRKDLAIELRTGEVTTTSTLFAVLVVVMASLAFYGGPDTGRVVASGVIWLSVAFAAVLGLGRSWQREREENALDALVVAPIAPSAVFLGKALGIAGFLAVVELVVVPLSAVFFTLDFGEVGPGLFLIGLAATPGLAASGTLFGAMTVRTRARDLLLALVLFPLLVPTLLAAVAATRELLGGTDLGELFDYFELMLIFDVTFVAGGLALFGTLTEG